MTPEQFREAAGVSRETLAAFETYETLLRKWQGRINLVGPSTLRDVWGRHFFDCAQLVALVERTKWKGRPRRWADFGTGAGFPGLVLSLLGESAVTLVEQNPKKCAFLRAVVRETGAAANILCRKLETVNPFPVDFVTSRALAPVAKVVEWAEPFVGGTGGELWLLKGRSVDDELTFAGKTWNIEFEKFPSRSQQGGWIVRMTSFSKKPTPPQRKTA